MQLLYVNHLLIPRRKWFEVFLSMQHQHSFATHLAPNHFFEQLMLERMLRHVKAYTSN